MALHAPIVPRRVRRHRAGRTDPSRPGWPYTEAWYTDYVDGVRFSVDITPDGHDTSSACAIRLNPRANEDERQWIEVRIPLGGYVGRRIEITLRTDPVDDVRNDWSGWGNPLVVIDRTLLRPPNGPDVPMVVVDRPIFVG